MVFGGIEGRAGCVELVERCGDRLAWSPRGTERVDVDVIAASEFADLAARASISLR